MISIPPSSLRPCNLNEKGSRLNNRENCELYQDRKTRNRHKRNNKLPLLQHISTSRRVDAFPPSHLLMEGSLCYLEPAKEKAWIKAIYITKWTIVPSFKKRFLMSTHTIYILDILYTQYTKSIINLKRYVIAIEPTKYLKFN